MMRLIDADALIPMMKYATTDSDIGVFPIKIGFDAIVKVINAQPTIEPERKRGKWVLHLGFSSPWECSECNTFQRDVSWYCPHCGVQMEVRG